MSRAAATDRWEYFCDPAYFDLWCVRLVRERRFGHGFHVQSSQEAAELARLLNLLPETAIEQVSA